jgi:hypothetical protein
MIREMSDMFGFECNDEQNARLHSPHLLKVGKDHLRDQLTEYHGNGVQKDNSSAEKIMPRTE